jgi:prefoldin subunit 5
MAKYVDVDVDTRKIENKLDSINTNVQNLEKRIKSLENRVVEVEKTKAKAKQAARVDIIKDLQETYEQKRRQYEQKKAQILEDYKDGINRLKDRFISSISDQSEHFDRVSGEFDTADQAKKTAVASAEASVNPAASTYRRRLEEIGESRQAFIENVDAFLRHREETAQTIESLQTPIPGIDDSARIDVPFWVVAVEKDGQERLAVLPVLERTGASGDPTPSTPYVPYLQPSNTHDYQDLTDAVKRYAQRDAVLQRLDTHEGDYADPSFLAKNSNVNERFVEALEEYQLDGRMQGSRATADSTGQTRTKTAEVATDD